MGVAAGDADRKVQIAWMNATSALNLDIRLRRRLRRIEQRLRFGRVARDFRLRFWLKAGLRKSTPRRRGVARHWCVIPPKLLEVVLRFAPSRGPGT